MHDVGAKAKAVAGSEGKVRQGREERKEEKKEKREVCNNTTDRPSPFPFPSRTNVNLPCPPTAHLKTAKELEEEV